jgi:NTE family protein
MLRAISRTGLVPDVVVGTSVGAVNGAFFASDPTPRGVERLAAIWHGVQRRHIYPAPAMTWIPTLLGRRAHLCDAAGLRALLSRSLGDLEFSDMPVSCAVVAADFSTSEEVVLQTGRVADAVLASAAVPVVFPAVSLNGRLLVDGALSRNTPIGTALALGATRLVVLPTGFACGVRGIPRSAVATALHHISVLLARQLAAEALAAQQARPDVTLHIAPPLCPMPVSSYDFSSAGALIARAEDSTAAWIAADGLLNDQIPMTLAPHTH